MRLTNENIIQECLQGNRRAQKELFHRYNAILYTSACTFVNNSDHAKGIVQETWIDIFKGLSHYDKTKSQLITWMKTILIRKAWHANKNNNKIVELKVNHKIKNHQQQIIDKMSCQEILNELDKIPAASRMVFKLYVLEEYKHSEIAKLLNISVSTSRVHLTKARAILKNRFIELNIIKIYRNEIR